LEAEHLLDPEPRNSFRFAHDDAEQNASQYKFYSFHVSSGLIEKIKMVKCLKCRLKKERQQHEGGNQATGKEADYGYKRGQL
jgi:hypothetical protein